MEGGLYKVKRELGTVLALSILLGASLVGVGTGTACLITQHQHYSHLCEAINLDVERLEISISHLQESLTSLAEAVMQKW